MRKRYGLLPIRSTANRRRVDPFTRQKERVHRVEIAVGGEKNGSGGRSRGGDPEVVFAVFDAAAFEVGVDDRVAVNDHWTVDRDVCEIPKTEIDGLEFLLAPVSLEGE
jgi:hypothetical protein